MRNISLYVWFFSSGWISRSGIAMSKIMNLFQSLHMYCQIALQKVCVYQVTFPQAAYEIVYRFLISDFIVFAYLIGEKRAFVVVLCLLFWEFLIWLEFGFIHCFTPSLCDIFEFVHFLRYVDHSDEEYNIVLSSCTYKTWIYFVVNLNGAYPKLVPFRPAGRLISPPLLLSVILNILLSLAMHIVGFILVQRQPWYSVGMHSACTVQNETLPKLTISPTAPEKTGSNGVFTSFENTTTWFLGTINCIIVALVFSKGKPFRQPTYKNCE